MEIVKPIRIFYTRANSPVQVKFNIHSVNENSPLEFEGEIGTDAVKMRVQGGSRGPFLSVLDAGNNALMGAAFLFVNDYGVPKMRMKLDKYPTTIWVEIDISAPKSILESCGLNLEEVVTKKAAYLASQFATK